MNGILITGTHKKYVLSLGTKYTSITHCLYYAVVDAKNHTSHSIQLSPYAASMIKAYTQAQAKSQNKTTINTVVLCIQTPQNNDSLHKVTQEKIDSMFRTEWCFILDIIRHSVNLLQKQTHIHPLLLISIFPTRTTKEHKYTANTSDLFSHSLRAVIKTFSKHFPKIKIVTCIQKTNSNTHIDILQKIIQKKSYKMLPKNNTYNVSNNKKSWYTHIIRITKINFIFKKIMSLLNINLNINLKK